MQGLRYIGCIQVQRHRYKGQQCQYLLPWVRIVNVGCYQ